jgi:hypothetical protein
LKMTCPESVVLCYLASNADLEQNPSARGQNKLAFWCS